MTIPQKLIRTLLRDNNMLADDIDHAAVINNIHAGMTGGLQGEPHTLRMLPTGLCIPTHIPTNIPITVLDAGGTNLRVSRLSFDATGKAIITHFKKFSMPGFNGIVSKKSFFKEIADHMEAVLPEIGRTVFCFSYPAETMPDLDGRLIRFCKEIQAPEVEGELIGKSLKDELESRGHTIPGTITILNDTTATLLAGVDTTMPFSTYIGSILGTGTNTCYIEQAQNIHKTTPNTTLAAQIINMESGDCNDGTSGAFDISFDATLATPGSYLLEKKIAGAYLGPLISHIITTAKMGIFSEAFVASLQKTPLETPQVSYFMHNHTTLQTPANNADKRLLYYLADEIIERATLLAALQIAAPLLYSNHAKKPLEPACITIEGTTHELFTGYKDRFRAHLAAILTKEHGRYYQLYSFENAVLYGTAKAGLGLSS